VGPGGTVGLFGEGDWEEKALIEKSTVVAITGGGSLFRGCDHWGKKVNNKVDVLQGG